MQKNSEENSKHLRINYKLANQNSIEFLNLRGDFVKKLISKKNGVRFRGKTWYLIQTKAPSLVIPISLEEVLGK